MAEQISLTTERVELTDEEKIERGTQLANAIREAELLETEHEELRKDMRKESQAVEQRIAELANVVRTGKEERPVDRQPA